MEATTLTRLLTRLDHSLLSPTSDTSLRTSQYERNRVSGNLEHARTLLLTLEKQAATVRVQSQRQATQADLQRKRELLKKLNGRLQELNKLDEDDENDDSEDGEDDGEDLLKEYAPARQHDVEAGLDTGEPQGSRVNEAEANILRSRRPQADDTRDAATTTARETTSTSTNTARETLFANRSPQPPQTSSTQHEATMSHNRTEQEALSTGLIGLARALKESSIQFSAGLEAEKDILKRAEGGLDKSALGMEAAERKMGLLRRMSEGQGWWGRIKLYGFIFALWVVCFMLVFVGPKLRF